MKEEDGENKTPIKLGTLTPDLVKKLSGQLKKDDSQINDCVESPAFKETSMQHHHINEFILSDALETKTMKPFDFKNLSLSLEEIKKLSNDELLRLLSGEGHDGSISDQTVQFISNEILIRQIKEASKPHWTVKPTFYAVVFFGLITIVIGILSLLKQLSVN